MCAHLGHTPAHSSARQWFRSSRRLPFRSNWNTPFVTLHTQTAGGGEKRTHLWVVDDTGAAWLRAGMSSSGWLARIKRNPIVLVERGGRLLRYRAVPIRQPEVRDRIHALMREKYGTADRLVGVLRDPA
ncbi:MAG TPA: nitroreductase/quinone reductase family protein [Methylomirabilota bacterium]